MLSKCGYIGRIGNAKVQKNTGYLVSWAYAGGATVASPATIWSENTSDANNNITVKYNGVIAYLTKTIAGTATYATVATTLSAGTYPVRIILNADNTMKLVVNNQQSYNGFNERLINGAFASDTDWTHTNPGTSSSTITGGLLTLQGSATEFPQVASVSSVAASSLTGRFFRWGIEKKSGATANATDTQVRMNSTDVVNLGLSDAGVYSGIWQNTVGGSFILIKRGASTSAMVLDNASFAELHNNTDTTAIPWTTVL